MTPIKLKLSHSELKELDYYLKEVLKHIKNVQTQYSNELTQHNHFYINAQVEFITNLSNEVAKKLIDLKASYNIKLLQIQALTIIKFTTEIELTNPYTQTVILDITTYLDQQLVNKL